MEKLKIKANVTKVESDKVPSLKALASITIGGIKIDNVRVSERSGYLFVDLPQKKDIKDGETIYKDMVSFGNGKDEEYDKKVRNAVLNTVLKAYEKEGKTTVEERETDFNFDNDKISSYVRPVNSEKIKGVATLYYGNVLRINPVFLKEIENRETHENNLILNFVQHLDKEGKYNDIVYPIEKGLRTKFLNSCIEQYEKNIENQNESNEFNIEDTAFYKEIEAQESKKTLEDIKNQNNNEDEPEM